MIESQGPRPIKELEELGIHIDDDISNWLNKSGCHFWADALIIQLLRELQKTK